MNKKKSPTAIGPRKAPKQERSRQTYQIILNGATAIIRRDGLKKLSTNRVAEESKVSIGSLYQYFPSKQAIIAALIDQVLDAELARVTTLIEGLSPDVGPRKVARTFFFQYYRLNDDDDLALRKTLVEAVPNVERAGTAMQFHSKMAEMIITYFRKSFQIANETTPAELFVIQYLLKAVTLSSVDDQLKELEKEKLIDEWAEVLLNIFKVRETI
jgi:AcrR family transcriptional regulator